MCIPLGEGWIQPEIYGNSYEEHRSFWSPEEFKPFIWKGQLFDFPNLGPYGAFLRRKENYLLHEARERADALFAGGAKAEAIACLSEALEALPPDLPGGYLLVDMLLNTQRIGEAVEWLKRLESAFPGEEMIRQFLARLVSERPNGS